MTVPPSLSLEEAAARCWEIVVLGAGPAGALAARELARWGLTVLLVDRAAFPRWKVCGCCLNGRAQAVLASVGLGDLPCRLGAVRLRRLLLASDGQTVALPLQGGVAVSREGLDAALVKEAIAAGAAFLPRTRGVIDAASDQGRIVWLHEPACCARVKARVVLAATGLGGRLTAGDASRAVEVAPESWIGAGVVQADAPSLYGPHTIYMACGTGGYVGLVRLEDGRLNVAAALDPAAVHSLRRPGAVAACILREAGFRAVPALAELAWRGTPALTRRAARPGLHRVFLLGDVAGYIQPFTGEGIAWALEAARAVVPVAVRAAACWKPSLADQWTALYHRAVTRHQVPCRLLMAGLRHPRLTAAAIALLTRWPALSGPVIRRVHPPAPTRWRTRP